MLDIRDRATKKKSSRVFGTCADSYHREWRRHLLFFKSAGLLVKVGHCSAVLFLTVLVALSLGMSGCDSNSYSAAIRYLVRTDPLVTTDKLGPPDNPGGERNNPDRPGQLPIFSAKDLLDLPNSYYKTAPQERKDNLVEEGKMIDPTK